MRMHSSVCTHPQILHIPEIVGRRALRWPHHAQDLLAELGQNVGVLREHVHRKREQAGGLNTTS